MKLRFDSPLIAEFINKNGGDGAVPVIKAIEKQGKTDEQISKKTKLGVNDIRAILNRLHNLGVIHYDKKKASDSNWYTYTWFLKKDRVHELMSDKLKQELTDLSKKLEFEQNYTYYKCYNGCDKLAFEIAFEYNFKCPECGNLMNQINNNTEKKQLSGRIGEIKKFLNTA